MEKKHKIIIIGLIIVIIALIAGLAMMLGGGNVSVSSDTVKDGMMIYNFDSVFTMQVPKGTTFNKTWNDSSEDGGLYMGDSKSYLDLNKKFGLSYVSSPMLTNDLIDFLVNETNSSGNASVYHEGDFIIMEKTSKKSQFGDWDAVKFSKGIVVVDGTTMISIYGNDLDELKEMANTIKFRGD
ncbi:hypothetical protein [Methanobrevibacter sp.]|uniref:hypothetical protein n=1 Tax=Methanobrevibacter sp. TaxID=66852 RepID=UPI00386B4808